MVKKLLNPLVVSAFIFVLLLGSVAHLMYGSCQSSKWHYIVQNYYTPSWVPFRDEYTFEVMAETNIGGLIFIEDFTGIWKKWDKQGRKISLNTYINSIESGKQFEWYKSGAISIKKMCNNGLLISIEKRNEDGTLNLKEYYDPKGKFLKRELFEKGKLVKTETEE
ncbi:MAG: hypothetical protein COA79_18150 [Planctomycetota bacterium]|nr:MAG: hypothetical protein COA79_18150 [Planctomycetota bacterium]